MTRQKTTAYCIIVAAGSGLRFGSALPKQFCELEGLPVVMHAIKRFRDVLPEAEILLVINRDFRSKWTDLCRKHNFISPTIIDGGLSRWHSVKNAISVIPKSWKGPVLIHDGARPLVEKKVIIRLLEKLKEGADGVVPCIPAVDSLRMATDSLRSKTVDRSRFFAVQTPQAFPANIIAKAYDCQYSPQMTDDASVCEINGYSNIRIAEGSPSTLKITHPADLATAAYYLTHN